MKQVSESHNFYIKIVIVLSVYTLGAMLIRVTKDAVSINKELGRSYNIVYKLLEND